MRQEFHSKWAASQAPRARPLLAGVVILAALSSCTLISVGTLVGKGFVPALGKGDKEALKRISTEPLAGYWDVFTEEEIRAAVGADQGPTKPGAKRPKGPRVRLVSFKVKGHEAELVARRGKDRFRFLCQRTEGGWKVADVSFTQRGQRTELVRTLQVLVAAKTLQVGLERGSRYLLHNVASPSFRTKVLRRIGDAELLLLEKAALSAPKRPAKPKGRARARIESEVTPDGALVRSTGGALPIEIRLVDADGQFVVDEVSLGLGGHKHELGDLLAYTSPTLRLIRWALENLVETGGSGTPTDSALEALRARIQGLFSRSVWGASLAWLSTEDLKLLPWDSIRGYLSSVRRPGEADPSSDPPEAIKEEAAVPEGTTRSAPALGPGALTRLERDGDQLHLEAELRGHRFGLSLLEEAGGWRIHGGWFRPAGAQDRTDAVALLAALGPLVHLGLVVNRLAPELSEGEERGRAALKSLIGALGAASSADANRRIWSLLPKGFVETVPIGVIAASLVGLFPAARPGPGAGAVPGATDRGGQEGSPGLLSGIDVTRVKQTRESLILEFLVSGRELRLDLVREDGGWKLDDVHLPLAGKQRSLKDVGGLLIPAISLAQAVLGSDREALRLAVTPKLRREVVDPLLHIFGWRFKIFMGKVRSGLLPGVGGSAKEAGFRPKGSSGSAGSARQPSSDKSAGDPGMVSVQGRATSGRPRKSTTRKVHRGSASKGGGSDGLAGRGGAGRSPREALPGAPSSGGGMSLDVFRLDSAAGRATVGLVLASGVRLQAELARDSEGRWGIDDLSFPLAGREVTLARAGPVLAPILGFGFSLLEGDLGAVRRASSRSFNKEAWRRMTPKRFRKLVSQITDGRGGAAPKGRSRGKGRASPGSSAPPRIMALRIRDKARWPWAQVELGVGGRRILASLVRERDVWKVHDLELQIGGMSMSVKKLIALGF